MIIDRVFSVMILFYSNQKALSTVHQKLDLNLHRVFSDDFSIKVKLIMINILALTLFVLSNNVDYYLGDAPEECRNYFSHYIIVPFFKFSICRLLV
jgi:hypothetical protein